MQKGDPLEAWGSPNMVDAHHILLLPAMKETRNNTIKIKNSILAIPAAPAAMPKKPNAPATRATIRKMRVQRSITYSFMVNNWH